MLKTCSPRTLQLLFDRISAAPECFASCVFCSPFLDDYGMRLLFRAARSCAKADCSLTLITTPAAAKECRAALGRHEVHPGPTIFPVPGLHAKIYAAFGRSGVPSTAIVTSANLTSCGLRTNMELGVVADDRDESGRQFIHEIRGVVAAFSRPRRRVPRKEKAA